jgi:hypothetical protein
MDRVSHNNLQSGGIDGRLAHFESISLGEMEKFALMNRKDTKFVMDMNTLRESLEEISKEYWVLEINGRRRNSYQTLYFDTPDLKMYNNHHNGVKNRYKVRTREYLDSGQSFIEVKFKNNKERTIKKRVKVSVETIQYNKEFSELVTSESGYSMEEIIPALWNRFTRITLVSKQGIERVTIDINMEFSRSFESNFVVIPGVVVVEVKQDAYLRGSRFIGLMKEKTIRQEGFSKYCIGVSLLFPNVKKNNFKGKIRLIEKLVGRAA